MSFALTRDLIDTINKHAIDEYPKECCGVIADGVYFPSQNVAIDPKQDFVIPAALQVALHACGRVMQAVVHSHPNGPRYPSEADMRGQVKSGLPWVLVATDGEQVTYPEIWGDGLEIPLLVGREFMHGIRDCYSLVRDVYRLGKAGLAVQSIDWPLEPILLADFPRNDSWWGDAKTLNQTLYEDNFAAQGFKRITREDARAGDAFLLKMKSQTPNHAGVLLADGTILHHLPMRLSGRVPAGLWAHAADAWLRYEGVK